MNDLECKSIAYLSSVAGIGQRTLFLIVQYVEKYHISWDEFWQRGSALWKEICITEKQIESIHTALKEQSLENYYSELKTRNIRIVLQSSTEYPPLLKQTENPPIIFYAKGQIMDWSTGPPIAVVGTRHITAYGKLVTEKITSELVLEGCPIVSGGMYGVDICAHRAALDYEGQTVAVLGYGFNYIYPRSYAKTFEEFLERGMTLITPFAPTTQPNKGNFPARNAIVAGMSAAVVVTEAAEKSGTHITAEIAADLGRPVCAVPGPITSPYSTGTKILVNQGAALVSSGEEVLSTISQ